MKKIPIWVFVIGVIFFLAPLAFSIMGYAGGPGEALAGVTGLYLARNLATALVMLAALIVRSPGMLLSAFLLRLFTDILDIINTMLGGGGFPAAFLVFVVLALPCVFVLWPRSEKAEVGGWN